MNVRDRIVKVEVYHGKDGHTTSRNIQKKNLPNRSLSVQNTFANHLKACGVSVAFIAKYNY